MMVAVEAITGRYCPVWHKDSQIDPVDLIIVPGGFSFGDYLRCGVLRPAHLLLKPCLTMPAVAGLYWGFVTGFRFCWKQGCCQVR